MLGRACGKHVVMSFPLEQFRPAGVHLDTASVGLVPRVGADALHEAVDAWHRGQATAAGYDVYIAEARRAFSRIVGCPVDWIAITTPVSVATAHAAALLAPGDTVLAADEDFTSVLFPFLERERDGIIVRSVPLDHLIDSITDDIDMVAVSAVQSADGRRIDLDLLAATARAAGALTYLDVTQAAGWVSIDATAFDITACGIYKWLCSPRGAGFMTVAPHLWDKMRALAPGWYAGEDPWTSTYNAPLRQAASGRRYDVSPAWLCWVGAAPVLDLFADIGATEIGQHNIRLANAFRTGLGLDPSDTAMVSLDLTEAQVGTLQSSGVNFANRAGRSRFSFHLYNTDAEVEAVLLMLDS